MAHGACSLILSNEMNWCCNTLEINKGKRDVTSLVEETRFKEKGETQNNLSTRPYFKEYILKSYIGKMV